MSPRATRVCIAQVWVIPGRKPTIHRTPRSRTASPMRCARMCARPPSPHCMLQGGPLVSHPVHLSPATHKPVWPLHTTGAMTQIRCGRCVLPEPALAGRRAARSADLALPDAPHAGCVPPHTQPARIRFAHADAPPHPIHPCVNTNLPSKLHDPFCVLLGLVQSVQVPPFKGEGVQMGLGGSESLGGRGGRNV